VIAEDVEFISMIAEMEGQTFRGHEGARARRRRDLVGVLPD
jgi:hypothetical protein